MSKDVKRHIGSFVGVLPQEGEHKHLTRSKNFAVVGGNEDSHAIVREAAIKIDEQLDRKGREVSVRELRDIIQEATDE